MSQCHLRKQGQRSGSHNISKLVGTAEGSNWDLWRAMQVLGKQDKVHRCLKALSVCGSSVAPSDELPDPFSCPGLQNCECFTESHPALKFTSFSFSSFNFMLVIFFPCVWKVKWMEAEHRDRDGELHVRGRMTQNQRQSCFFHDETE